MLRIGFVDKYLDNWHTNHYPDYLRLASRLYGIEADVVAAWAEGDHPQGGLTTDEWCRRYRTERAASYEELIAGVDGILVLCADDCLPHEALAQQALAGGKPIYCDKTFAPDLAAATRMFDRAEQHGTPLFTCSAQRYCMELLVYLEERAGATKICSTTGPGDMVNYSIHQYEMIEHTMGPGARRCRAIPTLGSRQIIYEYDGGRRASFTQSPRTPFSLFVSDDAPAEREIAVTDYYMTFMLKLLQFMGDGKPPVARQDTLEIMALQQAGRQALAAPGGWVELPR